MATKVTLNSITAGYSVTDINDNFTILANAIDNTLSLDGTSPNTMSADLDMNSKSILNEIGTESISRTHIRSYNTLDQDILTTATDTLEFDTEDYDTLSEFNISTYQFTVINNGYYLINVHVKSDAVAMTDGDEATIDLYKNGVYIARGTVFKCQETSTKRVEISSTNVLFLRTDDYLEAKVHNNTSVTLQFDGDQTADNFITIDRIL